MQCPRRFCDGTNSRNRSTLDKTANFKAPTSRALCIQKGWRVLPALACCGERGRPAAVAALATVCAPTDGFPALLGAGSDSCRIRPPPPAPLLLPDSRRGKNLFIPLDGALAAESGTCCSVAPAGDTNGQISPVTPARCLKTQPLRHKKNTARL